MVPFFAENAWMASTTLMDTTSHLLQLLSDLVLQLPRRLIFSDLCVACILYNVIFLCCTIHKAITYNFVVKQLQHMLVGDLVLVCVGVRYCAIH